MITDGKKIALSCCKKIVCITQRNNIKACWRLLLFNCPHSYSTKNKPKKHKNVCENHDCCHVEVPEEDNKILKYNHGKNFVREPYVIYTDLLEKKLFMLYLKK